MHRSAKHLCRTIDDDPQVGDALRAGIVYGSTRNHLVYVREDLHDPFKRLRPLLTAARHIHESLQHETTAGVDAGQPRSSIHVYEELVVVQLLAEETIRGIILVFDPDIDVKYPGKYGDSSYESPVLRTVRS